MQKLLLITVFSLFTIALFGQHPDYFFSGDYNQVPFDRFVESIESSSGLTFFYRASWTSGVTVTATGNELSLDAVLKQNLEPYGLNYYIDEGKNVFILKGVRIKRIDDLTAGVVNSRSSLVEIPSDEDKEAEYFGGPEEVETIEMAG